MINSMMSFLRTKVVQNEEAAGGASASDAGQAPPGMQGPPADAGALQYDAYAREWQGLSGQDNFDGFRVEAAKPMTKYMQTTHSLYLGTMARPGVPYMYQFGPIFQSADQSLVLMGKAGLDGTINARAVKKVLDNCVDLKMNISSDLNEPQRNMMEGSVDMNLAKIATSFKLVYQQIWILNASYSQLVTPNLHLGAELTYLDHLGGASMGVMAARYSLGQNIFSATLGRTPDFKNPGRLSQLHGARMQYIRKVSDRLSLGAEYEYSYPDHESAARMGWAYTFRTAQVQGLLDTAGKVSCYVNDFKGFGLSGMIDYVNNDYRFGFLMHYLPAGGEGGEEGQPPMM